MRSCIPGSKSNSWRSWPRSNKPIHEKHSFLKQSVLPAHVGRRGSAIGRVVPTPPLRIVLVLDNLAGHLSYDLVRWFFDHGVMPLYTPVGGSWLNMAESVQRIIVRRALAGQHPQTAQEVIDWLEQTVEGWNDDPTPFVWNGKRRRRRERARLRRLAGSGAALVKGYAIAS